MNFDLSAATALLARTPAALNVLLRDLPDSWTLCDEGDATWTPKAVVAHLVHCERSDWMVRTLVILGAGESQPFQPLDRNAHLHLAQNASLPTLLDGFTELRAANLSKLAELNLQPGDLARRGTHPVFGPVTLSQLLATWATHDMTHLHQIARILAHQYREAVGPWSRFLGVLHCNGHSEKA